MLLKIALVLVSILLKITCAVYKNCFALCLRLPHERRLFVEDEGSDPQAVDDGRPSAEGVVGQGPETRCWRQSRGPDKPSEPREQGARFASFLPRQAAVPDGSPSPVHDGKWELPGTITHSGALT